MTYIGIDPGKDGALAVIDGSGARVIPFDTGAYLKALSGCGDGVCVLERVFSMKDQGVKSMFSFGQNFGWIMGALEAFGIRYELVLPKTWKKEFGISGKNESIDVCRRLFPDVSLRRTERCRKEHDGMAEALLMAEYARRRLA